MTKSVTGHRQLSDRLQNYLSERYPEASISGFEFMASGFESDLYAFDLLGISNTPKPLVLRLFPGEGAFQKISREARGLQLLQQGGYPAPELFRYEGNPAYLGKPFMLIERLSGQSLWPILAQANPQQARRQLERFGRLQAQLHQLDWRPFTDKAALYETNPSLVLDELLAVMHQEYFQYNAREFLEILDWLESHKAHIIVQPAVVHLDFHANNALLCQDNRIVIIDWTQIRVADYRLDLTWTLMIMSDYGQASWGKQILKAYSQASKQPVVLLDYFYVMTYLKLLSSTVISLKNGPDKLGMRPETLKSMKEQAASLRRLFERIQDLTQLNFPEVENALANSMRSN
jgi:aminoglycoside phosphotransferase (APT) family kinase protein